MITLVLLYFSVGLFSAATHYLKYPEEFNKDDTQRNFLSESNYGVRVILSIFIDMMTWPVALVLKLRERNK